MSSLCEFIAEFIATSIASLHFIAAIESRPIGESIPTANRSSALCVIHFVHNLVQSLFIENEFAINRLIQ